VKLNFLFDESRLQTTFDVLSFPFIRPEPLVRFGRAEVDLSRETVDGMSGVRQVAFQMNPG
jgi:hypothetical protein